MPGLEEDVGMIGLHWGDQFLELVPWTGHVSWQVSLTLLVGAACTHAVVVG